MYILYSFKFRDKKYVYRYKYAMLTRRWQWNREISNELATCAFDAVDRWRNSAKGILPLLSENESRNYVLLAAVSCVLHASTTNFTRQIVRTCNSVP